MTAQRLIAVYKDKNVSSEGEALCWWIIKNPHMLLLNLSWNGYDHSRLIKFIASFVIFFLLRPAATGMGYLNIISMQKKLSNESSVKDRGIQKSLPANVKAQQWLSLYFFLNCPNWVLYLVLSFPTYTLWTMSSMPSDMQENKVAADQVIF